MGILSPIIQDQLSRSKTGRLIIDLHRQDQPKDQTEEAKRKQYEEDIKRARNIRAFSETDFWKNDLLPWLLKEWDMAGVECLKSPAMHNNADAVAMDTALQRGRRNANEAVITQLNLWLQMGDKAQEKMQALNQEENSK